MCIRDSICIDWNQRVPGIPKTEHHPENAVFVNEKSVVLGMYSDPFNVDPKYNGIRTWFRSSAKPSNQQKHCNLRRFLLSLSLQIWFLIYWYHMFGHAPQHCSKNTVKHDVSWVSCFPNPLWVNPAHTPGHTEKRRVGPNRLKFFRYGPNIVKAVSYTHLTLPTIYSV